MKEKSKQKSIQDNYANMECGLKVKSKDERVPISKGTLKKLIDEYFIVVSSSEDE
jgi:hypothetical protein